MSSPFLTVDANGIHVEIDLSSLLTYGQPNVMTEPKAPVTRITEPKAPAIETTSTVVPSEPKAPRTSEPKAPKRAKRQPKADGKATYREIFDLTKAGRIDEAKAMAAARNWPHVIESIDRYVAKHSLASKGVSQIARGTARRNDEQADRITAALDSEPKAPSVPKAPTTTARKGRPQCPVHKIFLRGNGTCSRCETDGGPATEPEAPQAPAAPPAPKAKAPKAKAPKAPSTSATKAPKAPVRLDLMPSGMSESEYALHWLDIAARAKASGSSATLNATRATFEQAYGVANNELAKAAANGDRLTAKVWANRRKAFLAIVNDLRSSQA